MPSSTARTPRARGTRWLWQAMLVATIGAAFTGPATAQLPITVNQDVGIHVLNRLTFGASTSGPQ